MNSESVWVAEGVAEKVQYPALARELSVDVAIVGGGITGLTTALLLKRAGKRVAVIEAKRLAHGVTAGTTGHLTQVLDTRFHELERTFGRDGAALAARSGRVAIEQIESFVKHLDLDCDFHRVPGYLVAENKNQAKELDAERDACERIGLAATPEAPVLPFPVLGGLRFPDQARIQPTRYAAALARQVDGGGSHVFEHTRAVAIDDGDPCRVHTSSAPDLIARKVVLATHSPLTRVVLQTKIASYRSYVVSGPARIDLDALLWDLDAPYHYVRSVELGGRRHLLVGGEDHKTGDDSDGEARFERLEQFGRRLGLETVTHRWSSQVVEPVDGLPFIGRNASSPGVYVATGYSGNGLTFGTLAGLLIRDDILGVDNELAELYSPKRFKAASLPSYLAENVDFPIHLLSDAVRPVDLASPAELQPGSGAVTRVNGLRLAVYRDLEGKLHAVSPICTHLGCHVKFNAAEASWDCPCHGSRFTPDGDVIHGPAVTPLVRHALLE